MDIVLAALFFLASVAVFYSIYVAVIQMAVLIAHAINKSEFRFNLIPEMFIGSISFAYIMWYIFVGGWSV